MPSKMRSPLLGYNHNLKYKGRVYHVQTEDSGVRQPHVFTHLFYDGTILATKKTDYAQLLGVPDSDKQVRRIMQEQHKDMMKELLRGIHDEAIGRLFGTVEAEEAAEAAQTGGPLSSSGVPSSRQVPSGEDIPVQEPPPSAPEPPPPPPAQVSQPSPSGQVSRPLSPRQEPPPRAPEPPPPPPAQVSQPPPPAALAKDVPGPESAFGASHVRRSGSASQPDGGQGSSGTSSVVTVAPVVVVTDIGASPRRQHRSQTVPRLPTMQTGGGAAPAPSRSSDESRRESRAARPVEFRPEESRTIPPTVFTNGVVEDEEGLDEVILQYLAEDLPDE